MANYTKTTDFEVKDSLPSGDPGKIIKGTEFEVEFDAISASITTKADQASPTFTGTATFADLTATGSLTVDGDTLVVDDVNNRVGINTASPSQDLSLFTADAVGSYIDFSTPSRTGAAFFGLDYNGGVVALGANFPSGGDLALYSANSQERMRITASGDVGIGTASPKTAVDIVNASAARIYLGTDASNYGGLVYSGGVMNMRGVGTGTAAVVSADGTNSKVTFTTAGVADRMVIDSSGRVGIGNTNPTSKVTIGDGTTDAAIQFPCATKNNFIGYDGSFDGLQLATNGEIKFQAGTSYTERMRIDSSGNVNIAGGTTNTSPELQLTPTLSYANTSAPKFVIGAANETSVNSGTAYKWEMQVAGNASGRDLLFNSYQRDGSAVERMRIDSLGNVTVAESGKLYLKSSVAPSPFMEEDNQAWTVNTGSAERMRIDALGSVAIGTGGGVTAPGAKFQSNTSVSSVQLVGAFTNENMSFSTAAGAYITIGDGATTSRSMDIGLNKDGAGEYDGSIVVNEPGGSLDLGVANATQAVRIDSSGDLLVGTTSSVGIETGASSNEGVQISTQGTVLAQRNNNTCYTASKASGYSNGFLHRFSVDGSLIGSISTNGTTTSFTTSSDVRLKENITDADSSGSVIDALQVRQYDWKADGSHQRYGFVAQELDLVFPEAVSKGETEDDMWSVDYSKLVPMLVKEIQDLKAEVEALKNA